MRRRFQASDTMLPSLPLVGGEDHVAPANPIAVFGAMPLTRRAVLASLFAAYFCVFAVQQGLAQSDPLASWNDTPTKAAIIDFVARVTTPAGPEFVPEEERVAVFDMDGTLIPEKPVPAALIPIIIDIKAAITAKPMLAEKPGIQAFLRGDEAALAAAGEQGLNELIAAATDGKTTEEFSAEILPLMEKTPEKRFGVPYTRAVYQPMRELLAYLEANGFQNWICSGSPILFTRAVSEAMLGIPPQRVMGSTAGTRLDERGGKTVLVFDGSVDHVNDREGKPPTINLALGMRPVFVGGNEGGGGDIAMMRWSKDRKGPSFQLLINHDDADREFAYAEPDGYSLNAASKYGFHVVSMKQDWKVVVAP
ncbi:MULTISPECIES: HAD family hydrolase [Rhizobium]|uniref:Haloacid dehalogenase-like hydrolase n=1 Tax=Rhizobium indicum TaxID=2583231 RepID=A0ABX6PMY8_9HYPH|nr:MULTISPECIES: haloacid dehalogenase-like hydrolase [Rhizobium]NNU69756.1 haloacid dehalogenase-like hydrolase [Rhizobium sp. WYCCWR 11152]NYT32758.1 haloacid dehalogenase-like hydrolase [Rhizobium sp. WYCCWR 11128]QKK20006.1 haloacid dehalogenase-like hydrolase [Rhizobium indicum]